MVENKIYLDYAAATPVDQKVLSSMQPYFSDDFYNPSANYAAARKIADDINLSRAEVAEILSVKANEIYFAIYCVKIGVLAQTCNLRSGRCGNIV